MIWGPRNTEKGFLFLAAGVSRRVGRGFEARRERFRHIQPLWSPLKAKSEWQKGPNPPAHMSPYLFHPCSTLFHPFGASRAAYGHKAHFWPFSAPPEPTDGNFWTEKWSQSTGPYVPSLVPPLFHFVPPIRDLQSCLWPKKHIYGIFRHSLAINPTQNKVGTKWNKAYLYQTDPIKPKNHSKSALSFSTLCIGVVQVYVWYRYRCGQVLVQ